MIRLKIISVSTRPGRKGPAIASWILARAKARPEFETELLDLAEINLPFLDEPAHPRLKTYQHDHTKRWSATIDPSDAFIFVTPEYNHGYPAPLKNALDFLYQEWNNKPAALVSYGGIAGGTRSLQLIKPVLIALKMTPVLESVNIPFFTKYIDDNGEFKAEDFHEKAATTMFTELARWGNLLKEARASIDGRNSNSSAKQT